MKLYSHSINPRSYDLVFYFKINNDIIKSKIVLTNVLKVGDIFILDKYSKSSIESDKDVFKDIL